MGQVTRLETLARIGFAARGILYLLIGYAALVTDRAKGSTQVISDIDADGPGQWLLVLMGLGFLGYGLWRLFEAATDSEGNGDDAKGWAVRTGGLVSGLIHLGLCATALRLAFGNGEAGNNAAAAARWTLDLPGGNWLLIAAALALLLTGLFQLVEAVRLKFLKYIDAEACRHAWVRWSGRIGHVARGIAFIVIAWLLWRAAMSEDVSRVGDWGAAIEAVPSGVRGLLAGGLALFGLFSFVQARYRRINDPRVLERLKAVAR